MKKTLSIFVVLLLVSLSCRAVTTDSLACGFSRPLSWRIGAELSPAWVPSSNSYLRGYNDEYKKISSGLSGDIRMDFSFSPESKEGILYPRLYQGAGVGVNSFFSSSLLGTPVSLFVYQGAPIIKFTDRIWLGYEWQFGAAFGWKHYDRETADDNIAIGTSVTAMLGLGLKLHYELSERWRLSLGINGTHYSNGNTSLPNAGVNAVGATIGVSYVLSAVSRREIAPQWLVEEADKGDWFYDILVYGAWRKRTADVGGEVQICPGRFGIAGLGFSPLRKLNRYVAVGPSLDMQWDEGAALDSYWVEGTTGGDMKFVRPPFGKQLSFGLSAHAELTMPIFSVNAGIGYDFVSPKGEKRFYQSLTLKTFLTRKLFLNVGYRLGDFKDPQNLMLGVGMRL